MNRAVADAWAVGYQAGVGLEVGAGLCCAVMSSPHVAFLGALLLSACATTPTSTPTPEPAPSAAPAKLDPVPAGELRRPATYSMLAVLLPEGREPKDVVAAIAEAARPINRSLTQDTQELIEGAILVDVVPVEKILAFQVIDFESLGIAEDEAAKIKKTTRAVSMVIAGPAESLVTVHRHAAEVARAAVAGGGWLFDGGTFQVFTRERFDEFRPAGFPLEVERLITVMVDDSKEEVRLETFGMERLGLPELRMAGVPKAHTDGAVALFNAAAQVVIEQAYIERAGELVIDLRHARMPHLKELHEEAVRSGGGEAVTLAAFWDRAGRTADEDPVLMLDLISSRPSRHHAFGDLLRKLFGAELEAGSFDGQGVPAR